MAALECFKEGVQCTDGVLLLVAKTKLMAVNKRVAGLAALGRGNYPPILLYLHFSQTTLLFFTGPLGSLVLLVLTSIAH